MNREKKIITGINITITAIIMIASLFYINDYLYNEPTEVRARADELCLDHFNQPSSMITRSLGNPDEWHFLCEGHIIAYMFPISESAVSTVRNKK